MPDYTAPLQQMRFTIEHLADFKDVAALQSYASVDLDTVEAVLEEAGRFAGGVLAPINWLGDRKGVQVVDQAVQVPAEFTDGLRQVRRGRLAGHRRQSGLRRAGPAQDDLDRLRRNVGGGQRRFRAVPRVVAGRHSRARSSRLG